MVREFYSTLNESNEESITVRLRGVEYLITLDKLAEAHGIPNLGSKVAKKSDITNVKGYNELAFKREVLGNPKVKEFENVISSRMKLHSKVLHKLITNYISPKNNSYQYINATKLYIIRHIQKLRDLNLCYLLIENMMAAEKLGRTKALLYGMVLTKLFKFLGVELSQEIYTNVSEKRELKMSTL